MEEFVVGDTHFGQQNILTFTDYSGNLIRPFKSLEEMHEYIINGWNSVVGPNDLVIHVGDVAFSGQAYDKIMPQLHGVKYLVRGNHDTFSEGRYRRHFKRVLGAYVRDKYIFTHVPIHPDCVARFKGNVHGHLHSNLISDNRYFNACLEVNDFKPVSFTHIKEVLSNANTTYER